MYKLAIITTGYTGSTLPLAKELLKQGHQVDFYLIRNEIIEVEALNCTFAPKNYGITKIPKEQILELSAYMNSIRFNLFCISLPRPYRTIPIVSSIMHYIRDVYIDNVCKVLNAKNYNCINFSTRFDANFFVNFLKKISTNTIVSLHEVSDYKFYKDTTRTEPLLSYLINSKTKIILHSRHTYNALKKYPDVDLSKVEVIPFGLFDSYNTIPYCNMDLPQKYILFYGGIYPYKGLKVLYDAVSKLGYGLKDYKVIVAGKGYDPIIEKIVNDNRYRVINRRLSNSELVTLLFNSKFVVCPYLTVSQSGIPQTSYVYKKPIIASDLPAFKEVIVDMQDGLLFETANSDQLAIKIKTLINNEYLLNDIVMNITDFERLHPLYSWSKIAERYVGLFN